MQESPDIQKSNMELLREWFRECPALNPDSRFRVDFLADLPTEYALYAVPSTLLYRENVLGEEVLQDTQTVNYIFASRESYSGDTIGNLSNAVFYEYVLNWILEQNAVRNFPKMNGGIVRSIVPSLTAYPAEVDSDSAKYQIQLKLTYRVDL